MRSGHIRTYPRVTFTPTSTLSRGKCDPTSGRGKCNPRAISKPYRKHSHGDPTLLKVSQPYPYF